LEQKTTERTSLAQEIGVTTFNEGLMNPYDQLLIKSKENLEAARRRRIEVGAQYDAMEIERQPSGKTAGDAMAQELATKDNGLTSLKSNLYIRRSQLLSKLSGLASEHPGRKAIERELSEIDVEIARASETLTQTFRSMSRDQRRAEVYQTRRIENELAAEVQAESQRVAWFASRYHGAVALGDDIARTRKRIAAIDDRVDFLTLEASAPGFVRMVSLARVPELPFKGGKKKLLAFVLIAALAFGLFAPIAVDFIDPRIHAPDELERILGFAPTGWIIDRKNEPTRLFAEDQLIRLATKLDRERREHGAKVIVFTSAGAGEGTTTLVLGLAQALIKLGTRAIAVEANAFKPDDRYLSRQPSNGLIALLDGKANVEELAIPGDQLLPERMRVGQAEGRRPLATIGQLRHALTELARCYEIVLLDAPPALLSADAELLAGMSDATLLIVEADGEPNGNIKRAARVVERLSPPVFGAILNRVQINSEGGYFASLVRDRQSGKRLPARKMLSPWLWK
jgi:Mrp family chromosome partitioning ATPase